MTVIIILFWLSWLLLAYHLVGYGLLLFVFNKLFPRKQKPDAVLTEYPRIIVLCPAFNEEKVIEDKIHSFLNLNYPQDKISMIVISDDSTDATNEIVKRYTDRNISLVIQKPRAGKQSAHNLVLPQLDCDFVLSTDANSIFSPDAVMILVKAITADPAIGMVAGSLKLVKAESGSSGEGLYWKYESYLKQLDSAFHSIICGNGSIFIIKRSLFTEIHPQSADDFERTLIVLKEGYIATYEPSAVVYEDETEKASQEISRKIRIINQEWYAVLRNALLLNPFRYPKISFLLISHKLLRWLFFVFVLTGFITSALLLDKWFYSSVFVLQVIFYLLGALGLAAQAKEKRIPFTGFPGYFVAMIYSSAVAFLNFLRRKNYGLWKPIR